MDVYSRVYNLTGSDYCSIDVDTLLYKWSYDQFLPLETYIHFQEDRREWAERQQKVDESLRKGVT